MNYIFIDAPFDPDEREPRIETKKQYALNGYKGIPFKDPFDGIIQYFPSSRIEKDVLNIEPWLLGAPDPICLDLLTPLSFISFIDANGCLEYANNLCELIEKNSDKTPVMVGIDHSLTGGSIKAITHRIKNTDISLLIFDSHFDAVTSDVRCGLIQYDIENNPASIHNPYDPFIRDRVNSYNTDSFLNYIVEEEVIPFENVYVIGVSDYPPPIALEIDDPRVKAYVNLYTGLIEKGINVIRKEDILKNNLHDMIKDISTSHIYISFDVDICGNSSVDGARFMDGYVGLYERDLRKVLFSIYKLAKRGVKLAGIDISEIDIYTAENKYRGKRDKTYSIFSSILFDTLKYFSR